MPITIIGSGGGSSSLATNPQVTFDLNDTTPGTSVTPAVPVRIKGTTTEMVIVCKAYLYSDLQVQFCVNLAPVATLTWAASNAPYTVIQQDLTSVNLNVGDVWTINILASDGSKDPYGIATAVVRWNATK
jgi:hypothetical protein